MKKNIFLIIIVLLIISCEKEVVIPIEYTQQKLVVNALFCTDSLWEVELSASKYIYDTVDISYINNAQITISDSDGNSFLLTNMDNGIYKSTNEQPEIGKIYTLNVSHDDYDNVSASNQLPGEIAIDNISWEEPTFVDGDIYRKINLTFQDSPEDDYYLIRINTGLWEYFENYETGKLDSVYFEFSIPLMSQNINPNENDKWPETTLSFTDNVFNGTQYTIDLLMPEYYFTWEEKEIDIGIEKIYISMSKISQEYYWYSSSYRAYLESQNAMFAQPTQVYTNIENGLGIFAGYSTTLDSIAVE